MEQPRRCIFVLALVNLLSLDFGTAGIDSLDPNAIADGKREVTRVCLVCISLESAILFSSPSMQASSMIKVTILAYLRDVATRYKSYSGAHSNT